MSNVIVTVNDDQCIGCGVCSALCSTVFKISTETGKAMVNTTADLSLDSVKEAEEACPVGAISLN